MGYDGSVRFDTSVDVTGFTNGISKLKNLATGCVSAVTKIFTAAVTTVSAGFAAAVTAATNVGSEFEAAISKVSAISGTTGESLDALTEKAKELGATTKFSATESAEAFQYMAMAGWKTEDMLSGIDGIMNLSAADGLDLATTSDIVTDAITAFGLSAKDSTHFADVLATASSNANTNVSMLGESFKYVAPLAGAMNYSVEDVSLALGLMANASVKGSMAGTSLKTALANLSAPTKEMQNQMDSLGISMTDSNGKALSLREIIVQLREKFSKLSETEQTAAASTLFGKEAMSGMLAIINASDEDFNKLANSIDNADGTAQKMAETLNDNLKGKVTIMKSALEGLGITIYEQIEDKLKAAVEKGTDYIDRLSRAFESGGLEEAILEAGKMFGELATEIAGYAPDVLKAAVGFIKAFAQGIIDNRAEVVTAVREIVGTIGETLFELLPDSIRRPVESMTENLKIALGNIITAFTDAFDSEDIGNAIGGITDFISDFVEVITDFVKKVAPPFSEALKAIKDAFASTGFQNAVKKVKDAFRIFGDTAARIAKAVLPLFTDVLSGLIKNLDKVLLIIKPLATVIGSLKIASTAMKWVEGLSTAFSKAQTGASGLFAILEAHPFVAVATAIGTAITALAELFAYTESGYYQNQQLAESWEMVQKETEKAEEKLSDLGEALNMDDEWNAWIDNLDSAKSSLDGLAESQIFDTEKMSSIKTEMEDIQQQINEIAGTYSDERKELTNGEIQKLEELFEKMRELSKQELELTKGYQNAANTKAEIFIESFNGTGNEYLDEMQSYIKGATEARDKVIAAAEETYNSEIATIGQLQWTSSIAKKEAEDKAYKDYQEQLRIANEDCAKTLTALQNGYKQQSNLVKNSVEKAVELKQSYKNIVDSATRSQQNMAKLYEDGELSWEEYSQKMAEIGDRLAVSMQNWGDKMAGTFSDTEKEELASWLAMIRTTQEKGVELDEETTNVCVALAESFSALPPETKESMGQLYDGVMEIVSDLPPDVRKQAEKMFQEMVGTFEKENPSATAVAQKTADDIVTEFKPLETEGGTVIGKFMEDCRFTFFRKEPDLLSAAQKVNDDTKEKVESAKTEMFEAGEKTYGSIIDGGVEGINSKLGTLIQAGANAALKTLAAMNKGAEVASPSKATKRMFGYVIDGCVLGITENQDKVFKSASDMALETLECISDRMSDTVMNARVALNANTDGLFGQLKEKLSNTEFITQLKAAVVAESASISGALTGRTVNSVVQSNENGGKISASGNITTHINIDGREFAIAVTPFIDEELGFS